MSMIILLNGCGSAGKTSIARSIQHLSETPWLHLSLDMFFNMIPAQYRAFGERAKEGVSFIPGKNDRGPLMKVESGPLGQKVFGSMPYVAEILAERGNNLIIDDVILGQDAALKSYGECLALHKVYFVGVFCDLPSMQEREILRGDRAIGLSNDQMERVHTGVKEYDLKVDSTYLSPFMLAREILAFINKTPDPQSFKRMQNINS